MKLSRYLSALGYGTRRDIEALLRAGRVGGVDGAVLVDGAIRVGTEVTHHALRVDDLPLDPPPGVVVLLHKPTGYVCSTEDRNPLIYELLPERFPRRTPRVSPVGRLDLDSSGALLLTDNGQLIHQLTTPKSHLPKRYELQLAEPLRRDAEERFASGTLQLHGENKPLLPAHLERHTDTQVSVTIVEGRYHQLRRMFAAVGNHVTALHRDAVGPIALGTLDLGAWRLLLPAEHDALLSAVRGARPRES